MSDVEVIGGTVAPAVSDEGMSYYRTLLGNPAWVEANPAHAAALRASVDRAVAQTGYTPPAGDERSPTDQLLDRNVLGLTAKPKASDYSVSGTGTDPGSVAEAKAACAAMQLDRTLGSLVARELVGPASDPEGSSATLAQMGRDPEATIGAAQTLLDRAGYKAKSAAQLSPTAIVHLALWAGRLQARAAKGGGQ